MKLSRRGIFNLLPAALVGKAAPAPTRYLIAWTTPKLTFDGGFGGGGGSSFTRFDLPLSAESRSCIKRLKAESSIYSERIMEVPAVR